MDIVLIYLLSWLCFLFIAGYSLGFIQNQTIARVLAWTIVLSTTFFAVQISFDKTPLYRMIAIVCLQLVSMKGIVMVEHYRGKPQLNLLQWLAFAGTWFGMRPKPFETFPSKPLSGLNTLLFKGVSRIIIGYLLLFLSLQTEGQFAYNFYTSDLMMLAGMSFILHFGILNLNTLFWRLLGVDLTELFIAPYKARSLKEFWGKRWNMAFSEMTSAIVYKPLIGPYGKTKATLAAFLFSGLLHEVAISFPVHIGYGLPLVFFMLHAIGMSLERNVAAVKSLLGHKVFAHIWVFAWLLIPMPLLFHPTFVEQVAKPLREVLMLGFVH